MGFLALKKILLIIFRAVYSMLIRRYPFRKDIVKVYLKEFVDFKLLISIKIRLIFILNFII